MDKKEICEFGRRLIETRDLDPVYVVLWKSGMKRDALMRWLLAYWCFYHVGTASWVVDSPDFWTAMLEAASTSKHPRSSERRHFRGRAAVESVSQMRAEPPESIVERVATTRNGLASEVMENAKRLRGFGGWAAFKAADMIERLGLARAVFCPDDVLRMFEAPRAAAFLLKRQPPHASKIVLSVPDWAYRHVLGGLPAMTAPPRYERAINIQEAETILCKWKSSMTGRYEIGEDIDATRRGLSVYPESATCRTLLDAGAGSLW